MELVNPIKHWAELIGAPETALALILSLVLAMPVGLLYLWLLSKSSPTFKHCFFIVTGTAFLWINYGHVCNVFENGKFSVCHFGLSSAAALYAVWDPRGMLACIGKTYGDLCIGFEYLGPRMDQLWLYKTVCYQ